MPPAERARMLRIAPAPQVPPRAGPSPQSVASARATAPRVQPPMAASAPSAGTPAAVTAPVASKSAGGTTPATGSPTAAPAAAAETPAETRVLPRSGLPADPGRSVDSVAGPPPGLMVPVRGVAPSELSPTFEDARSEGRVHEALDIMAPAGTPVLAVADGHVEKLFDSRLGGLTIYQFDPGARFAYYYAHLERYAPGLAEQQQVRRGEVIGYVGSSGNADPAAPHLHFAIFLLGPEKQWWKGTAIDPYPLFAVQR
ncbi:peptidoglycan DD-metalloendopeptidase family protein [Luteimonas sp. MJ204]|uniref:M23 family metallopeptidase n=1 Tax=Luteimonas sp. MJ145 TaxID=3129234 RepID=UPI0031BB95ED